jgi:predicted DNA-binding protein YlxM (UPF0122 family)
MYGDYDGPNKADKGKEGGSCNRTRCQDSPANYWNHGSYSWYCAGCAIDIGQDHVNLRGWLHEWYPKVGHAMFETRQQVLARSASRRDTTLAEIAEQTHDMRVAAYEQVKATHEKRRKMVKKAYDTKKMINSSLSEPLQYESKKPRKRKMIRH